MEAEVWHDHAVGDRVMTVEGYPGVVQEIFDGPYPGTERYSILLDNNMGYGDWDAGEIWSISERTAAKWVDREVVCRWCGGSGIDTAYGWPDDTCRSCNGTGYEFIREKVGAAEFPPDVLKEYNKGFAAGQRGSAAGDALQRADQRGASQWWKLGWLAGDAFVPGDDKYKLLREAFEFYRTSARRTGIKRTGAREDRPLLEPDEAIAAGLNLASVDYPELAEILYERPDWVEVEPASSTLRLAKTAKVAAPIKPTWQDPQPDPIGESLKDEGQPWWWRKIVGPVFDRMNQAQPPSNRVTDLNAMPGLQWCRFRRDGYCYFPDHLDADGTKEAGYAVWIPVNQGVCPRRSHKAQADCPVSEPGPDSGESTVYPDATIAWKDGGQRRNRSYSVKVELTRKRTAMSAEADAQPWTIVSIKDTRDFIEQDDRFVPIAGSGDMRPCDRCGRVHEIHATVRTASGDHYVVGIGCALVGHPELDAPLKAGKSGATTYAKNLAEVEKLRAKQAEIDRVVAEVRAMPVPEKIVTPGTSSIPGRTVEEWKTADGRAWVRVDNFADPKERQRTLEDDWYDRVITERIGLHPRHGADWKHNHWKLEEAEKRLAKSEAKMRAMGLQTEARRYTGVPLACDHCGGAAVTSTAGGLDGHTMRCPNCGGPPAPDPVATMAARTAMPEGTLVGDGSGFKFGKDRWVELEPGMWIIGTDDAMGYAYERAAMKPEAQARFDAKFPGAKCAWQRSLATFLLEESKRQLSGTAGSIETAKKKAETAGQKAFDDANAENMERMRRLFGPTYGTPDYVTPKAAAVTIDDSQADEASGTILALDGTRQVGKLLYSFGPPPYVMNVEVDPEYRRQGIATALWEAARKRAPTLRHSTNQTDEGREWAQAVGTKRISKWSDLVAKARNIRRSGGVRVISVTPLVETGRPWHTGEEVGTVTAEVKGDHAIYLSTIIRQPGTKRIGMWECSCPWASYSWARTRQWKKYEGRMCSHVLALMYEAQAQEMFGDYLGLQEEAEVPEWRTQEPTFYTPPDRVSMILRAQDALGVLARIEHPQRDALAQKVSTSLHMASIERTGLFNNIRVKIRNQIVKLLDILSHDEAVVEEFGKVDVNEILYPATGDLNQGLHYIELDRVAKTAQDDHSDGVMIALVPSLDMRSYITMLGLGHDEIEPEPAENIHLTMAYVGKTGDIDKDKLQRIVQETAAEFQPMVGTVGGAGVFTNDESNVLWVSPDVPGIELMRAALVTKLTDAGITIPADHGFTPHITVGYAPLEHAITLNSAELATSGLHGAELAFSTLVAAYGGEWTHYSLVGGEGGVVHVENPADNEIKVAVQHDGAASLSAPPHQPVLPRIPPVRASVTHDSMAGVDPSAEIMGFDRMSRCYELAGKYMLENRDATLVHGEVEASGGRMIRHAWVIDADGEVFEPTTGIHYGADHFLQQYAPIERIRYSFDQAATQMLRYKHWGPWDDERDFKAAAVVEPEPEESALAERSRTAAERREATEEHDSIMYDEPQPALPVSYGSEEEDAALLEPSAPGSDPGDEEPLRPGDPRLAWVMGDYKGEAQDDEDVAAAAERFLDKAGLKEFSPEEKAEIIEEGGTTGAANLSSLDLSGTHYTWDENEDDALMWAL